MTVAIVCYALSGVTVAIYCAANFYWYHDVKQGNRSNLIVENLTNMVYLAYFVVTCILLWPISLICEIVDSMEHYK